MTTPAIEPIAAQDATAHEALRALNNANAIETSFLTPEQWQSMIAAAFSATHIAGPAAFLVAFDQDADYDSVNFQWFRERLNRFIYIDRIVVDERHRGAGLARLMYEDLFARMHGAGHKAVGCEVNLVPPNPGSDAFHTRMGFKEMGRATLPDGEKTVRYYLKRMD